jgi:hypothetical protein
MHDTGSELGTLFDHWYQSINPMKILKDDGLIDIIVTKKIFIKDKHCNDSKEYDYFSKPNYLLI